MYCNKHGETTTTRSYRKQYDASYNETNIIIDECAKCRVEEKKLAFEKKERQRIFEELESETKQTN